MKKVVLAIIGSGLILTAALAQMQASSFQGTTPYQQGMSLEDANNLATVSEEEAILAAQTLRGLTTEPLSAEITVLDGFIVWAVDFGDQITYVDISDAMVSSNQDIMASAYSSGESEEYEDDDDNDYEDDDDDDYEDNDEYEDDDDGYEDEDDD